MDSHIETGVENSDESSVSLQRSNSFVEIETEHNSSSPVTPKGGLDTTFESDKVPEAFNSGSGSSDKSPTHDSDSSSSEFDSEAEAFYSSLNHHLVSPGTTMHNMYLDGKQLSYGELMARLAQCEEELKTTSQKLQDSELVIEKLKSETEKSESGLLLAEKLRAELETAQREIETRNTDIDTEKKRVLELEKQVADLESKLLNSSFNIQNLTNELQVSRECQDVSNVEISKLREMLCDCQQSFSTEKTNLQTYIADLLDQLKELEDQIETKEIQWQAEINALKAELTSRDEHIETLNKDFDKHKLSLNMLMAEKDGVNAELDNLKAEQIEQMEELLSQSHHKHMKLEAESEANKNTAEELKAMVKGLEKLLELQRKVISEGEEEKREVIRQLCFSLDHYRTGYKQLLRFLSSKNKQQTIII